MKYLIGIISGIVLAAGGAAVVSSQTSNASAGTITPLSALTPQTQTASTALAKRPSRTLTGELSRSDSGALELKVTTRQNGELVDRDVRILTAHAKVTNGAGRLGRLPLADSTARVTGVLLARANWRVDEDGQRTPTINAARIVVIATTPPDDTDDSNEAADQAESTNEKANQGESTNEEADQAESTDGADKQND